VLDVRSIRLPLPIIAGIAIALVGVGAGITMAAIPSTDGSISGCYVQKTGALRVIDAPTASCGRGEVAIKWQQTGPAGAPGPAGPAGPKGDLGPAGPVGPALASLQDLNGIPCDTPAGLGVVSVDVVSEPLHFPITLACIPEAHFVRLSVQGLGIVTVSPDPVLGSNECAGEDSVDNICVLWFASGTEITLTAVPGAGHVISEHTWTFTEGCTNGAPTCSFSMPDANTGLAVGFVVAP
jgi:hypothetical protein